jgi:hypothetical protein
MLPGNLAIVALVALAPSMVLWWTARRLFDGIEVMQARYVSGWEAMGQR